MTEAEAAAWHGRAIRFGTSEAVSGADTCPHPVYKETGAPADSFLSAQYHIRATDLGLESSQDQRLRVTEVFCGERRWVAMGGVVFRDAEDHGYTVWDGVFFELRPPGCDGRRKH